MAVGIGDKISEADLKIMASNPKKNVMEVSSFDKLINEMNDKLKELLARMCSK